MSLGDTKFDGLVSSAPVNFDQARVDWAGVRGVLAEGNLSPADVVAVTWCSHGQRNIEALIDAPALTLVVPTGVISTVGKRKMLGKSLKYDFIRFSDVRQWGPAEHTDERGLGKYCLEFAGPGGVLLGRLQWSWKAKRFRDSRSAIMAVASERDRIADVVAQFV